MPTGHSQNWLLDNVGFALSLVPVLVLFVFIAGSALEVKRRSVVRVIRARAYRDQAYEM